MDNKKNPLANPWRLWSISDKGERNNVKERGKPTKARVTYTFSSITHYRSREIWNCGCYDVRPLVPSLCP
jgi:hypothetical protein